MILEIKQKLDNLEWYTEVLSVASTYPEDDFAEEPLIYGGAERNIIMGIISVVNISKDLVKTCNLGQARNNEDVIKTLAEKTVFPIWLAESILSKLAYAYDLEKDPLRNMSKHELYIQLDEIITNFRFFKDYVLEYIA